MNDKPIYNMNDLIEIKELRIGNLLSYDNQIVHVTSLSLDIDDEYEDTIGFCKLGSVSNEVAAWNRSLVDKLAPVSLTPQWLERCGFIWDKGYMKIDLKHARMSLGFYGGVQDKMSLFQTTIPGEGSIEREFGFGSNHPEYVHQLQNLYFALTGDELTIKN